MGFISIQRYRISFAAQGKERILLVTDAMRAKCMKNGKYELGGQEVEVNEGRATLADARLQ